MEQVKAQPVELKCWHEMQDDTLEIVACGKRWANVAEKIGCTVQGFNDDYSANFFTPDGTVIAVGPKFRAHIVATPHPAAVDGLVERYRHALERIADPANIHFAGDAQVVARQALAQIERKPDAE